MNNSEYKPIILLGAGFTGCDLLHLKITSNITQVSLIELSESIAKLRAHAELTYDRIKEINEIMGQAPIPLDNSLFNNRDKKSKFIKQQHRLAVKYSNKRR